MYDVLFFYQPSCPYSMEAFTLLEKKYTKAKIQAINVIDKKSQFNEFMNKQQRSSEKRYTVPQIYIEGKYVGGCSDLKKFLT